jgi:lipoate-protein ligase A
MAFDEALLECAARFGKAVARFYGWTEHAASFGYFQRLADVERLTPLRPLVRRPTGGGIVPHVNDWTYSIAIPRGHHWYTLSAIESYRRVHEWIQAAFELLQIRTELAPSALKTGPGQCFAGHEQFDLLWNGRKIAGAAQRRTKVGLLVQGSVQSPEPGIPRDKWQEAMHHALVQLERTAAAWVAVPAELAKAATDLAGCKYSRDSYNTRR